MTTRRVVTALSATAAFALIGLLAWGLLAAGDTGTLARDIADGKRPRLPTFDLAVLWPSTAERNPADRALLADGRVQTRELLGRPTLINIWASWCVPCKQEAPVLEQAAARYRGRVRFLGINVRDANQEARAFLRRYHTTYPNLDDPDDTAWRRFQATGVPESFLTNAAGQIVFHEIGPFTPESLGRALATVVRGSSP